MRKWKTLRTLCCINVRFRWENGRRLPLCLFTLRVKFLLSDQFHKIYVQVPFVGNNDFHIITRFCILVMVKCFFKKWQNWGDYMIISLLLWNKGSKKTSFLYSSRYGAGSNTVGGDFCHVLATPPLLIGAGHCLVFFTANIVWPMVRFSTSPRMWSP